MLPDFFKLFLKKTITKVADVLPYSLNDGNFSISVQNCNVTITNYDIMMQYIPRVGWLNYTVNGAGTQTFNFYYFSTGYGPWDYTVYFKKECIFCVCIKRK